MKSIFVLQLQYIDDDPELFNYDYPDKIACNRPDGFFSSLDTAKEWVKSKEKLEDLVEVQINEYLVDDAEGNLRAHYLWLFKNGKVVSTQYFSDPTEYLKVWPNIKNDDSIKLEF
jgi:hypothetical protein